MKNVLIVGYGIVGHNLKNEIARLEPDVVDKYKPECVTKDPDKHYHVAIICVDTPYSETGGCCDITEVENAIRENDADIYVIKSTILPGTTDMLCEKTNKEIIFSPEYYGNTQHCNNFDFAFVILGGRRSACAQVVQLLQHIYDARCSFHMTDAKTAELAKYMENSYLATKVSFCNQFWNIAQEIGVDYEELRELFVLDPRVNPSHTFVYDETPFWNSHCLNKDVRAVAEKYDAALLKSIIEFNEAQKTKKEQNDG